MEMRLTLDDVSVEKTVQGLGDTALDAMLIGYSVVAVARRQLKTIIKDLEVISNMDHANLVYNSIIQVMADNGPRIHEQDRECLLVFHEATNGASWPERVRWNLGENPEFWHGVQLDPDGRVVNLALDLTEEEEHEMQPSWKSPGRIPPELGNMERLSTLILIGMGLKGSIPKELGNLAYLEQMELRRNRLSGEIPPELANLSCMYSLDLSDNRLGGFIPPDFGRMESLVYLTLHNNRLQGVIPPSIRTMTNLAHVDFSDNQLQGSIPVGMSSLVHLKHVDFRKNKLQGTIPSYFGSKAWLGHVDFSCNELEGFIPSLLGEKSCITYLDLSNNKLRGEIPDKLANQGWLENLDLSSNRLEGGIPSGFGMLGKLRFLNLSNNRLEGAIPPELGNLGKLERFNVKNNRLSGALPAQVGSMGSLERMDLSKNALQGIIPRELERLENLRMVDMSNNLLQGDLPPGIGRLKKMEHLDFSNNYLEGVIPPEIEALGMLEHVNLRNNQLQGSIPSGIGALLRVRYLNLSFNQLQGAIPPDIGKLEALNHLYVNNNRLEGRIPIEISELRWLVNMNLSSNQLEGPLPPDLDELSWLRTLLVGNNQLGGNIPWEVGSLDLLQVMDLSYNQFQGELPSNMKNLEDLVHMDFSHNQLVGEIPEEFGELKLLTTMNLSHNRLEGHIPETLAALVSIITMDLSHNKLGGPIPWCLSKLEKMEILDLGSNQLRGNIPPVLGTIAGLKKLSLNDNLLEGDIPIVIGTLDRLQRLDLSNNRLQGRIPGMFQRLREIEYLYLGNNQLEGAIPPALGELERIQRLDLSKNQFDGEFDQETMWYCGSSPARGIPPEILAHQNLKGISLSNNKLGGTIPRELEELEHLDFLDLSLNDFEGPIPTGLGKFGGLRKIKLNNNQLGGRIPTALSMSGKMRHMDLSSNQLQGEIPAELGAMEVLKHLDLSFNQLQGSIPKDLGKLHWLQVMDLSDNVLQGKIPPEFATIYHLVRLDLSNNGLEGMLPSQLGTLKWLENVDVSGNHLFGVWDHTKDVDTEDEAQKTSEVSIPPKLVEWLASLARIKTLKLVPNPFRDPPEAVAKGGIESIERYYKNIFAQGFIIERRHVKVVIIGKAGAGKTSLRQSIREHKACPTSGPTENTVNMDIDRVEIGDVEVSLYDCAGQEEYFGLLQLFITRKALCLVVCDTSEFGMRAYGATDEQQLAIDIRRLETLGVCPWLRFLSWRLPECHVILVGSKCDLLPPGMANDTAQRIEKACQTWLAAWGESSKTIRLEPGVSMTSCAVSAGLASSMMDVMDSMDMLQLWKKRPWPCDWEMPDWDTDRGLLKRLTHDDGEEMSSRGAEMAIPHAWFIALTMLEALGESRNPLKWVRRRLRQRCNLKYEESEEDGGGPGIEDHGVITLEDLEKTWMNILEKLKSAHDIEVHDPLNALEGALSIRGYEGYVLRYGQFVFPDVRWLAAVLKPILHHNETEVCGEISLGKVCGKDIVLSTPEDQASWQRLKTEGILEPNLARVLWPDGLSEHVLPIIQNIDLAFPLAGGEEGNLAILLKLPKDSPTSAQEGLREFKGSRYPSMRLSWKMPVGVPPGAIENLMVRCCHLGTTSAFRRYGVLVEGDVHDDDPGGEFAMLLEYSLEAGELEVEIYGNVTSVGPWTALAHAMYSTLSVINNFPGLPWKASMLCPSHGAVCLQVSQKSRKPGDKLIARGCNICKSKRGLGAFAEELLREVDITLTQDAMLQKIKDKFAQSGESYGVSSMKDVTTTEGEQREALVQLVEDVQTALDDLGQHADELEDMRQELEATGKAFHLQNFQQRKLLEMIEAMRTQGDETQAAVDSLGTLINSVRTEQRRTPGTACMLPPWDFELKEGGLTSREQDPVTWLPRLSKFNFKTKGWTMSRTRLFLVCSRTYRLVPCGPKGQGYEITHTRKWAKRAAGAASFVLKLTSGTLSEIINNRMSSSVVGTGAGVMANMLQGGFVSELKNQLESAIAIEAEGSLGQHFDPDYQLPVTELHGKGYDKLREFIYDVEDNARGERMLMIKKAREGCVEVPVNSFVFFEDVMEQVEATAGGDLHWVLKKKELENGKGGSGAEEVGAGQAGAKNEASSTGSGRHSLLVKSSGSYFRVGGQCRKEEGAAAGERAGQASGNDEASSTVSRRHSLLVKSSGYHFKPRGEDGEGGEEEGAAAEEGAGEADAGGEASGSAHSRHSLLVKSSGHRFSGFTAWHDAATT